MPELPEVETIRRELASRIEGKKIERVVIPPDPRGCRVIRRCPSRPKFLRRLAGRKIVSIGRRAKYLLLNLEDGRVLILHLGDVRPAPLPPLRRPPVFPYPPGHPPGRRE
ncbi:MAG: DNA-formamidopyrimidine glycosylase family protein [Candidatus Erginobacter occultus]|nr:DNA-formamidopyrimidine glycosylase family protein [Candidatus Erginobacter occultus]